MTLGSAIEVPVLIVGGGPSGLCASTLLSRHGVESLTVERHPGTSIYPRATGVNVRSMEILRSFGLQKRVLRRSMRATACVAMSRVLVDPEPDLSPSFRLYRTDVSPADWTSCSQQELEPILLREAASQPEARLLFSTELMRFDETSDGITAIIADRATDQLREVHCRYLVAADGSKSSIRDQLGIRMRGIGVLGHFVSIHFSAALHSHLGQGPNFLHFVENEHVSGLFVAIDGESRWVFGVPYDPERGESPDWFTPERAAEIVRKGVGVPGLQVEVTGIVPWSMQADSAERWRVGRAFLAGDAAHRMTPAGGLGMNTGIQDVHNLCWKLAAVMQGWAGPGLLDTYEVERRPIAQHNVDRSVGLVTGAGNVNERTALEVDLGFAYASTAVVPDGTEPAARPHGGYEPEARPGSRAPHVWIKRGRAGVSTLDLFGPHFTVLAGARGKTWCHAADTISVESGVPLLAQTIDRLPASQQRGRTWSATYGVSETGAVLVRPDGHVAWRRGSAVASPTTELRNVFNAVLSTVPATGDLHSGDRLAN